MIRVGHVGQLTFKRPTGTGQAVAGLIAATGAEVEHVVFPLRGSSVPAESATVASYPLQQIVRQPRAIMDWHRIDVIHLHGAFVPELRPIASRAQRPYVVSPHGGYMDGVFASTKSRRKHAYFRLWEQPFLKKAASRCGLTSIEVKRLQRLVGRPAELLPNAIDLVQAEQVAGMREDAAYGSGPAVFLGRGDVVNKGLDRYAQLAAALPEVAFVAHLTGWERYGSQLTTLASRATSNVHLQAPVYGDAKARLLASTRAYVHLARWEAFGVSIAEAAAGGVPLLVSSEIDLAEDIADAGAGLVVDLAQWSTTVDEVRRFLGNESRLRVAGERAQEWARRAFSAAAVGGIAQRIYASALSRG